MSTNQLTYASYSCIHGTGLFARQKILKDTIIGYLQGKPAQQNGIYVLWIDNETGFEVSCDLKYINHSDSPNACYYDDKSVVALCDIDSDEEITHNYDVD